MPFSLTYVGVLVLTYLGVDNAETVVNAILVVAVAVVTLYGRYRAGGIFPSGFRKHDILNKF